MKKVLAMLLSLIMLLSLAACGKKPADDPGKDDPKDGPTEISLWSCRSDEDGEAFQRYVDDFNAAQSDYKLTMTYTGDYAETLSKFQATSAGNRPDLVDIAMEWVAFFQDNPEYYVPAQKFVDEDKYDTSDIITHMANALTTKDGDLMGMPIANSAVGFFYNTKLLEEAGIDPLTDLGSIEEIAIAADKLQANGVKYPIAIHYDSVSYSSVLAAQGFDMIDQGNGKDAVCTKCLIDEEPLKSATIKYFTTIQNMSKKGQLPPSGLSSGDLRQLFVSGDLAMFCRTVANTSAIGNLCNWEMEFGFHPSYTIDAGAKLMGQAAYGGALMIGNNNDDNRARGAWEFMKWLQKPETAADFAIISGYLPPPSAATSPIPIRHG